ncbi:MAG: ribosome small subunit-dependent GTPase A [Oscillospiraceae bacterium]|nr:ribosome small subunit-dependent GTPase A [Oscillospiraceae bacterium]
MTEVKPTKNLIIKGIGGFYYVKTADSIVETRAKGLFRRLGITPLAGDFVDIEMSNGDYVISKIYERKNFFTRPPAANIDLIFMVVSTIQPLPNRQVLDKLLAIGESKEVESVILLTKTDLKPDEDFIRTYTSSGYRVIDVRSNFEQAKKQITELMRDNHSMFVGNSGTGKTTLLNDLFDMQQKTDETSLKLGRGKHTTRAVELYETEYGYIADSPGFSAVDIERTEYIKKENLQYLFIDIAEFVSECRYRGCSHTSETDCAVIEAVQNNLIEKTRYESYLALYRKAEELNSWEQK